MSQVNQQQSRTPVDEHLHLSDLPRWPVWLWLIVGSALAVGVVAGIDEWLDGRSREITASALVRGVPPPAPSTPAQPS